MGNILGPTFGESRITLDKHCIIQKTVIHIKVLKITNIILNFLSNKILNTVITSVQMLFRYNMNAHRRAYFKLEERIDIG